MASCEREPFHHKSPGVGNCNFYEEFYRKFVNDDVGSSNSDIGGCPFRKKKTDWGSGSDARRDTSSQSGSGRTQEQERRTFPPPPPQPETPRTPYEILGVGIGASKSEIKAAYRQLANQNHPDHGGDTRAMQDINAAYDQLMRRW